MKSDSATVDLSYFLQTTQSNTPSAASVGSIVNVEFGLPLRAPRLMRGKAMASKGKQVEAVAYIRTSSAANVGADKAQIEWRHG